MGVSDFSSHPYSTYYGTSGSTAKQNFQQNDEMNDVYGYDDRTVDRVDADLDLDDRDRDRAYREDDMYDRGDRDYYDGGGGSLDDRGCLLYTSPSPRDLQGSRMPSSA